MLTHETNSNSPYSSEKIIHMPNNSMQSSNQMSFGAVIQKYRNENNMSQIELAKLMETSRNTITNWETDKSRPDIDAIRSLCTLLGIPLYELFGIDNTSIPTAKENVMLKKYRQLSQVSKKFIGNMIDNMLREETDARDQMLIDNYMIKPLHATPAAAGTGCVFAEMEPTPIFIKKNSYNESADSIVRVSGKSMEPVYHDGDLVYLQYCQNAENGSDVVCSTVDGAVIKRVYDNKLYSLNSNYPFGEKSEDDHVVVLGKVLGIVSADEIAASDDLPLLEELHARDLREFNREHHID